MTIHKYIETDNLIKYQNGRYKGHIDWSKNIDNSIYFEYEDIKGYIKIIDYEKSKQLLTVVYLNNTYTINTNNLLKVKLGSILKRITKEFKCNIGDVFTDEK